MNQVFWENECPHSIQYGDCSYRVILYFERFNNDSYFVYVRDVRGKYGLMEISDRTVIKVHFSGFDDIYSNLFFDNNSLEEYNSLENHLKKDNSRFPYHLMCEWNPLCFVFKGVNHLLTCYPVWMDQSISDDIEFGTPFVCESFTDESFFINGCEFNHSLIGGSIGRASYRTAHGRISYDEGGSNQWSAYEYERNTGSLKGMWIIEDDFDDKNVNRIEGVLASDIIFADFWFGNDSFLIGVAREGEKAIIRYDKTPEVIEKEVVSCLDWNCLDTKNDTIFLLKMSRGIRFYSKKKGFLSNRLYLGIKERFNWEGYEKRHFTLLYFDDAREVRYEYLVVDKDGYPYITKMVIW